MPERPDHLGEPEGPEPTHGSLNPLQHQLLEAIQADHGITLNELIVTLGLSRHKIKYQLNKMLKNRAIYSRKAGKTLHYFHSEKKFNRRLEEQIVLRDDRKHLILRELCSRETISSIRGFAAALRLDRNFVTRTLDSFEMLDLLEKQQCGGVALVRAKKLAYQLLERVVGHQEGDPTAT